MLSLWAKLVFVSSAAATCPDTLWAIARDDHFGATGRPVQGIVVGEMMRGVGQDVCIETNAGGKNVDVQVSDLTMSLDSIKQGIFDKLGAGDLCLWKKDGTLLSTGTLACHSLVLPGVQLPGDAPGCGDRRRCGRRCQRVPDPGVCWTYV